MILKTLQHERKLNLDQSFNKKVFKVNKTYIRVISKTISSGQTPVISQQ